MTVRRSFALGILGVMLATAIGHARAQQWTLRWADEFDGAAGTAPDPSRWGYNIGGGGWGNNELETYTNRTQNAYLDGAGHLVIKLIKEKLTGPDGIRRNYTSARLLTKGKFAQRYGRFEARLKLPFGQGIWPAFWLLGNNIDSTGWPACGEIDVMENIGKEPSIIHGTLHGPGYSGGNAITGLYTLAGAERFADDFHTFAIEWEPNALRFIVDGALYQTKTPADVPPGGRWVFDHPFFIILNVAIGGPWPGPPDDTTTFPQTMMVDYVRVYVDANTLPAITDVKREKKDLRVTGINFDSDAVILLNGEKQKTTREAANPAALIGKKLAKKIESGQPAKLQVRNSDGLVSAEYSYTQP